MALPIHLNYQLDVVESIIRLVDAEYGRRRMKKNDEEAAAAVFVSRVTTGTSEPAEAQNSLPRYDPELNSLQDEIHAGIQHLARNYKEIHEHDLKYFYLSGDAVDLNTYGRQLMSWTEEIRKDLIHVRSRLRSMRKEREDCNTALRLAHEKRQKLVQETRTKMAICERRIEGLFLSIDKLDNLVADKSKASASLLRLPLTLPAVLRMKYATQKSVCDLDARLDAIRSGLADVSTTRSKNDAEANRLSEDIKTETRLIDFPSVPSRTTGVSALDPNLDSLAAELVSQNLPLVTSHILEEYTEDFKKRLQDTYEQVQTSFEPAWNMIHWVVKFASDSQQSTNQALEDGGENVVSEFESVAASELWFRDLDLGIDWTAMETSQASEIDDFFGAELMLPP